MDLLEYRYRLQFAMSKTRYDEGFVDSAKVDNITVSYNAWNAGQLVAESTEDGFTVSWDKVVPFTLAATSCPLMYTS